jgi:hypothetical protein
MGKVARVPVLAPEHPDTLSSLNNLALPLGGQGKYEAVEEMHRWVLERDKKVLGPEHMTASIRQGHMNAAPSTSSTTNYGASGQFSADRNTNTLASGRQEYTSTSHERVSGRPFKHTTRDDNISVETFTKNWLVILNVERLRLERAPSQDLGQSMVIYGGERDACCVDCESFLARVAQADLVSTVLDVLGRALSSSTDQAQTCRAQLDENCWIDFVVELSRSGSSKQNDLLVSAKTNLPRLLADAENLLTSLVTALRPPDKQGLALSKAALNEVQGTVHIDLAPLELFTQSSCWHPLFPTNVVASAPVEHPSDMAGIEIPFDLMTELCGSDLLVSVDGGLCILGVFTLLVPVKVSTAAASSDCLQWHLICVPPSGGSVRKMRRVLWQQWADKGPKEWLKVQNLEDLSKFKRHFLGWCRQSLITLGTREQSYDLKRSVADFKDREVIEASTTFNLGFVTHGLSLGAGRTINAGPPGEVRLKIENET